MKRINLIKGVLVVSSLTFSISCSNLDEQILDGAPTSSSLGAVNTSAILQTAYEGLRDFQDQGMMFTMDEMSTDALVGPTRGGDWDDNAKWRQFHVHTWGSDNEEIRKAWNSLLSNVYNCNLVIENNPTASDKVQARFLRAFYYFNVLDLFGQTPYRAPGSKVTDDPQVWTRAQATDFVISELEAIISSLPPRVAGDPSIANSDAGHFLLAKLYLNKAVYTAGSAAGPYNFSTTDMNKVVSNVDAMSNSLAIDYWDNFAPNNNTSDELVFTSKNIVGGSGGPMQSRWRMGMHYNQTPGGWNGFATVAEYYNRFDANDARAHKTSASIIANFGNPIGFQVGQMYAPGGVTPLDDRNGHPLVYTPGLTLITSGATLETAGIRAMKYEPDNNNLGTPENDYVLMRYSDALLMKAEAIVRGASGDATTIMAAIGARANQPASPATLDGIYLERGKELWWEGWRRNDMIRFGKFLSSRELKQYTSDSKFILYPIPGDALFNSNLTQNPGY